MAGKDSILVFPLKEKHGKRVRKLVQRMSALALSGGGRLPLAVILQIAHWDKKSVGVRIAKTRGDVMLNSRRNQLNGTFMNTGKALKETVDEVPMMKPEIVIGRRIDGFFEIAGEQLTLHHIRGVSVYNTIGDNVASFTVKVKQVIISPQSVALI